MARAEGQVALEYLMTYAWALIAILIIAWVLFAIGILNPLAYQMNTCRGFGKIGYFEHSGDASDYEFRIMLGNGSGKDILDGDATVYLDADMDGVYENSATNTEDWAGSEIYTFDITTSELDADERYKVKVKIVYTPRQGLEQEELAICTGVAS